MLWNTRTNLRILHCREESGGEGAGELAPPSSGTPPPDYAPTMADPPVYRDALQDVILSTGSGTEDSTLTSAINPREGRDLKLINSSYTPS